ncbi:hypothetical protein, partial [Stenotrophomonas sp. Iso1]|uniref:hypothetical protein n=1 Tax=Stenotrophomonas sp. Iso1 TaxID=2977283 RepID=UPI0022B7B1F5
GFSASSTPHFEAVDAAASAANPKVFRRSEPPIMSGFSFPSTTYLMNLKFFLKLSLQLVMKTRCLHKK